MHLRRELLRQWGGGGRKNKKADSEAATKPGDRARQGVPRRGASAYQVFEKAKHDLASLHDSAKNLEFVVDSCADPTD